VRSPSAWPIPRRMARHPVIPEILRQLTRRQHTCRHLTGDWVRLRLHNDLPDGQISDVDRLRADHHDHSGRESDEDKEDLAAASDQSRVAIYSIRLTMAVAWLRNVYVAVISKVRNGSSSRRLPSQASRIRCRRIQLP
jgi:hypothetical protein